MTSGGRAPIDPNRRHATRLSVSTVKTGAGSELDPEAWRESLCRRSDAGNTVDAIAAKLPAVIDDEEDNVPLAGAAQRVGLNDARPSAASFRPVINLDL
jgi:hypothetical protein